MNPTQRILITGANGFIGSALTRALLAAGFHVRLASRTRPASLDSLGAGADWISLPDLSGPVDWSGALDGMDAVVHLPEWLLAATARVGDGCKRIGLPAPWTSEVKGKLLGDFFVDLEPIKQELGWQPPYTLEEGIRRTFGMDWP